jgi:geranylgeranyl pyrophosphate synthase
MVSRKAETVTDTNGYYGYFDEARRVIDLEILNIGSKIFDLRIGDKIRCVLKAQGKRLRPTLVMLSAQSVGGSIDLVKKLALAVELLHTATLVHDDILDQDTLRRNALTPNAKWGVRDAVLVGDTLASISLNMAADYDDEIVKVMSQTCLLLSDGEYMDIENAKNLKGENYYLEMIRKKSACLFRAATECGAMAGGGSPKEISSLGCFGENFGMAYQIKDDLSDMFSLSQGIFPQDINEFRATLPILHLCEHSANATKNDLLETIASIKTQSPQQRAESLYSLQKDLASTGSLEYCVKRIEQYTDAAISSLRPLSESVYKAYLVRMGDWLRKQSKYESGNPKSRKVYLDSR